MADRLSADLASLRIDRGAPPSNGRRVLRAFTGMILAAAVAGGVVYVAMPLVRAQLATTDVTVAEVAMIAPAEATVDLNGSGFVVPETLVKVGTNRTARIAKAEVKEGDIVTRGQVLFVLESGTQRGHIKAAAARAHAASARIATARATADALEVQLVRDRRLVASGAISQSTVDDEEARLRVLKAQVASAGAEAATSVAEERALETDLNDDVIRAAINGRAVSRPMSMGDVAAPEKTLVELVDLDSIIVEVDVPENRLEKVKPGTPCQIVLDAHASTKLRGEVVGLSPRINRAKATATVKVRLLDGTDLALPDMAARVSFLTSALAPEGMPAPRRVVPADAVVQRNGSTVVFTVDGGHAHAVAVMVGAKSGDTVELTDGPASGTRIVRSPPSTLADGQPVHERPAS